ncbi:MAG: 4-diphosphocytidyl-2-C-methyl-D-erythritol kinase [Alphaproteobacteria bacterium]|jgi:4-diphosphocytidyl-2-C-methyl-D-erythritol kinase|nr:4-diphosphocytidyl-2-C-methyl-D-erythritol kinase [Alphaproteobacteria bacterium]
MARLVEPAPAKVNLTLAVLGRRADGYHLLDSLVVFARAGDRLTFAPDHALSLTVHGGTAQQAGPLDDNLVLKAARALAAEIPDLKLGRFTLDKRLPVAAGLGGGSSDAGAALRLLARVNRIRPNDPRLQKVARAIGADVPVCVDPRPRRMRGIGDVLSAPLAIPELAAVLVNPGVAVPTKDVFAVLGFRPGQASARAGRARALPRDRDGLIEYLAGERNDLEPAAIKLQPAIARVLAALRDEPGCALARMSGSGATCFGLFASSRAAAAAARRISAARPRWWVKATVLG